MAQHVCRRLVLFLDGTWNEDEGDQAATNIVYLRERLFWGLEVRRRESDTSAENGNPNQDAQDNARLPDEFKSKSVSGMVCDGYEYMIYYDRGVGTGPFLDMIKGGISGAGLNRNIRQAYRFLSTWYRPGDQVFVFGFSRGAFTARSLCGYLQTVGLLRADQCTEENEEHAWRFYRTDPRDRLSGEWDWFHCPDSNGWARVHESGQMRVRALGVFDTVGALGIPEQGFRRFNRAKYAFHDTDVNSLVDIRLHSLSIDDPRHAFAPALWTKPKFKVADHEKSPTEQVWFAGGHADVGGGYVKWAAHKEGISVLPLAWMIQRVNHHLMTTEPVANNIPPGLAVQPRPMAKIPFHADDLLDGNGEIRREIREHRDWALHKPWAPLYVFYPANHRVINQLSPNAKAVSASGRVAFADPMCEMVHVSALERLNKEVVIDKGHIMNALTWLLGKPRYRPLTLTRIVPYLAATYLRDRNIDTPWRGIVEQIVAWKEPRIVDWNGKPLDPDLDEDAVRALALLPAPEEVGETKMPEEMKYIRVKNFLAS